ncbi:MAG TPA: YceI family protein [Candidatus Acidoferrales bacterium]|nr:YceI family protein [Candidatus Acidoferrales bacterium]
MSTLAAPPATATTWSIDPAHSVAEFRVRHMMISNVKGQFSGVKGSLVLDEADVANSKVSASVDAAAINTGEPQRDAHLRSADFLDAERFPALSFESTRVWRKGDGTLAVAGALSIHGIAREVVFEVEGPSAPQRDPWGNTRIGLSATTRIDRKDFGLTWNAALETGGILVGDEVTITLEVEFTKA